MSKKWRFPLLLVGVWFIFQISLQAIIWFDNARKYRILNHPGKAIANRSVIGGVVGKSYVFKVKDAFYAGELNLSAGKMLDSLQIHVVFNTQNPNENHWVVEMKPESHFKTLLNEMLRLILMGTCLGLGWLLIKWIYAKIKS